MQPRSIQRSQSDHDFADEIPSRLAAVGVGGFVERKYLVYNGLDLIHLDGAVHVLKHRTVADADTHHRASLHHENGGIDVAFYASQETDQRDFSAERGRFERSIQRTSAAVFNDVIDA